MILGVNIDHIATLRQARLGADPDPLMAAPLALLGGADSGCDLSKMNGAGR